MKTGDYCRAKCNEPARYLTDGLCTWISAQDNDLCVGEAGPKTMKPDLPLPSEDEVFACLAGLKHGLRTSAEDKAQRDASEAAYELVCRAFVGEGEPIYGAGAMAICVKLELKHRDDAVARVAELEALCDAAEDGACMDMREDLFAIQRLAVKALVGCPDSRAVFDKIIEHAAGWETDEQVAGMLAASQKESEKDA